MISTRRSVEIESRSHYLSGDCEDLGEADTDGRTVLTVCVVISIVCVMGIEVGVPDTSEREKITTSEVIVNEDVTTPEILSAKAAAGTTAGPAVGMLAETAVGMLAETAVGMLAETAVGMLAETAVGMLAETAVGMLAEMAVGMLAETAVGVLAGMATGMLVGITVGMAVGMVLGMSAGMSEGMAVRMAMLAGPISPREVAAEVKGAGVVKTSLGSVSDRTAVVSVVPVPLLRSPAADGLVTSAAGDIDVASMTSLLGTDESMGPSGDVVVGPSEFPPVVVTPSVGEPVGVRV